MGHFKGASTNNVVNSIILYPKDTVVSRGYSKLERSNHNLVFNNCEDFVTWCRSGGKTSNSI
ncbi:lecithin retinol acyltransferase family protein [Bacillus cereus]|uniref:lecithin retinol acyltransferase family protein n=1 Tax=Bacillus cereus TaxID=1396 RepID=UPI001CFC4F98